ncbi:MAG: PDDEXK nuclease domain-containing protein [Verrucomicrobia bacterium]|nr:PDDEXK nuclease domain-containing protein [Verrucomicrobiota bacterium]
MKNPSKTSIIPARSVLAPNALLAELRDIIQTARASVAQAVNFGLTMLHWEVGNRVRREILKEKRAEYGAEIVSTLSRQLEPEFGRGFSGKSLRHMTRFAEAFPDREIVVALMRQLSWSHFLEIIYLKDGLHRDFYAEMCRIERWSVRMLRSKIDGMLFERTALSKKPDALIRKELNTLRAEDKLTPDLVFRDPYVLDFLGLADTYSEADLEAAILREIERFLLELGAGFAFVARQKRITLDGDDYYIDLLFYHRPLRRLVVIELKLGEFKPSDSGQVELYLRWLDRHDRQPGEDPPLAIILCAGKKAETVEILDLGRNGIHVAEYLTELPPPDVLRQRLHEAVRTARARLEAAPNQSPSKKSAVRPKRITRKRNP